MGRILGQKLTQTLGQTIVIVNKPGASGIVGTEVAKRAKPNGYTFLLVSPTFVTAASTRRHVGFDPMKDFTAVCLIASAANVLVVNRSLPVKTVGELVAMAKSKPNELSYATSGIGSPGNLAGELFNQLAKVNILAIPYKGGGQAVNGVLGGRVPVGFMGIAPVLPHIRSGKLRALAVTSLKRSSALPDVPAMSEEGFPGYGAVAWYGMVAPTGTPSEFINKMNAAVVSVLKTPSIQERFRKLGLDIVASTPDEFASYIPKEAKKWSMVLKSAGVEPR
jgi:tripartite-type tricarboxylate transporter receptor subunit TctC